MMLQIVNIQPNRSNKAFFRFFKAGWNGFACVAWDWLAPSLPSFCSSLDSSCSSLEAEDLQCWMFKVFLSSCQRDGRPHDGLSAMAVVPIMGHM